MRSLIQKNKLGITFFRWNISRRLSFSCNAKKFDRILYEKEKANIAVENFVDNILQHLVETKTSNLVRARVLLEKSRSCYET